MKEHGKLKLALLRVALAFSVILLAFMTSYNAKVVGEMKTADEIAEQGRIAGWSMDVTCDKDDANKDKTLAVAYGTDPLENETNYYIAKVDNKSEVASEYSIVVVGVPSSVSIQLYKEGSSEPITATEFSEGKYIFSNVEKLDAGQEGSNLKLKFKPTSAAHTTSTEEIMITFKVEQDSGQA